MSSGTTASAWRGCRAAQCNNGRGAAAPKQCSCEHTSLLRVLTRALWAAVSPLLVVLLAFFLVIASNRLPEWMERAAWSVQDCDSRDRLMEAVSAGDTTRVRQLLDYGLNPDLAAENGITVLMCAAQLRDCAIMERLLIAGSDPNRVDEIGYTALSRAVRSNNVAGVQILLEYGANPNTRGRSGDTPLQLAREYKHHEIVQILLTAGGK